jgi:hypothetical protein
MYNYAILLFSISAFFALGFLLFIILFLSSAGDITKHDEDRY